MNYKLKKQEVIRVNLGVSICIPCFNSRTRLPQTLGHLKKQVVPAGIPWEVLVIDNASTDDTAAAAREIWGDCGAAPLRVVQEPRPGLSNARNCAFHLSRYDFVAFVDDDNWVCPEWVSLVYEILSSRPEVAACGGQGFPVFESSGIPDWFYQLQENYALGPQGENSGYVENSRGYLYGAGLTIRKSAFSGIDADGFASLLAGRRGNELSSGEDAEICFALQLSGWKLWYDPHLSFEHLIPQSRLNWNYLIRLSQGFGKSYPVLHIYIRRLFPSLETFQRFPVPLAVARRVRDSWLYQVYVVSANLRKVKRELRNSSADASQLIFEKCTSEAHLNALGWNPFRYRGIRSKIHRYADRVFSFDSKSS